MAVRFYIMPVSTITRAVPDSDETCDYKSPKYLKGVGYDGGLDVPWSAKTYGKVDWAVVAAEVTPAQNNTLAKNSDVFVMPPDLDAPLSTSQCTAVQNKLEAVNIPADWLAAGYTGRQVLKTVLGIFLLMQQIHGRYNLHPFEAGATLDTTFGELPAKVQTAISQVAGSIPPEAALRKILRTAAVKPIFFGDLAVL